MTLTKNQQKFVKNLHQKKFRIAHQQFVAEGEKVVNELLESKFKLVLLLHTMDFKVNENPNTQLISEDELKKISFLKTPNKVVAIFKIPNQKFNENNGLTLVLDDINDPGNLGTIIRLCDWFGVENLVCSKNTVDCYNAKVVQASMGSITRVNIVYADLLLFLKNTDASIFTTVLDGENVYETKIPQKTILIMGNEANGICKELLELISTRISIPQFGKYQKTESLNVATATSIMLSEYCRRN